MASRRPSRGIESFSPQRPKDRAEIMRVFLTGATGFLGAHVLRRLLLEKHTIAALIRHPASAWRISDSLASVQAIHCALEDIDGVTEALNRFAPDAIVHLAWEGVSSSHRMAGIQKGNADASLRLAQLASELGVKRWVGLGSVAEYGDRSSLLTEESPTRPTTEYGRAKLRVGQYIEARKGTQGPSYAWLRLFSLYGPMEGAEWFLPRLIADLSGKRRPALTEGEQKSDYLYVEDAADAVVRMTFAPDAQGIFNLGSGAAASIRAIAEKTRDLIDPSAALGFGEIPYRTGQVMHQQADIRKLCDATGWAPEMPLDEGLAHTVTWFRAHPERLPGGS